jgi:AcrR family transcriptional regulator
LSDEETGRRMLDAALATVNRAGLTVGLDHISFEDVIRDAAVSRTAAYRRWPYKDLFFSDLLKELARAVAPAATVQPGGFEASLAKAVAAHRDTLVLPEGRHVLLVELLRESAMEDFEAVRAAPEWRTYLALHATFMSLPDGELRDEIRAALATSEQDFIERVAFAWQALTALFGYRIRPGSGGSFTTIAILVSASLRGLVTMALSDPRLATRRVRADPAGAGPGDWSLVSMAAASVAFTFLEVDPDFEWDEQRLATVPEVIRAVLPGSAATDVTAPT